MTLLDLANIGQIIGSVAVVASLNFVGLQIRPNTKANRASTLQMNADYWLTYLTTLADDRFSPLCSKGALGREELDGVQFGQSFFLCRATFMGCENQHYQYRTLACLMKMPIAVTKPPLGSRSQRFLGCVRFGSSLGTRTARSSSTSSTRKSPRLLRTKAARCKSDGENS